MQEYDVALKHILARPGSAVLKALTGSDRLLWLNVETPKVTNLRVDLLGQSAEGELVHIEFQSRNERGFPIRMGEYLFGIARTHGRLPRQVVLYVGEARLGMKDGIEGPDLSYRFHMVDIRNLDGEALLASRNLGDNVMAILTKQGSERDVVRRIPERLAKVSAGKRAEAFAELLIVAGLRKLDGEVGREAKNMPILNDIMDHGVIGPAIRQGLKQGLTKGLRQGRVEGRTEGQMEILLGQIEKRFGSVPPRIRKRLATLKPVQIKAASLRLLDAKAIDDLFAR